VKDFGRIVPFWLHDGTGWALVVPKNFTKFSPKWRWIFFYKGKKVERLPSALDADVGDRRISLGFVPPGVLFTAWGRLVSDRWKGQRYLKLVFDPWFEVLAVVEGKEGSPRDIAGFGLGTFEIFLGLGTIGGGIFWGGREG